MTIWGAVLLVLAVLGPGVWIALADMLEGKSADQLEWQATVRRCAEIERNLKEGDRQDERDN